MKIRHETTTGTLHRGTHGTWYANTGLREQVPLAENLQSKVDPSSEGVEVEATVECVGITVCRVIAYRFL